MTAVDVVLVGPTYFTRTSITANIKNPYTCINKVTITSHVLSFVERFQGKNRTELLQ